MIYLKTPTSELTIHQIRKIVCETINWCETNFGGNNSKVKYNVRTQRATSKQFCGQYHVESQTITLFKNNCNTVKHIISTTLHEYRHHTQDINLYIPLLSTHGYLKHPQEIEARNTEKLYSKCWKDIKHLLR